MRRRFLVPLLIVVVAKAAPNANESDIDDVISHVDQFLQSVVSFTYNLSRFQGLEDVKEDKVGVTEFFDMLGDLFTNGTIGHFEEEVCKQP
ncbi:hypothetical protein AAVH_16768 [Aphelenchoides avenae]|nr:hypothetical protein AAVH_16768 [Aphelenchus avenae]